MAEETKKSAEETENKTEEMEAKAADVIAEEEIAADAVVEDVTNKLDLLTPGMVVRVHQKIRETTPKGDERERIQIFQGTIIAKKGKDKQSATITVRKVTKGYGVERIYPLRLPTIAKIEVVKTLKTRRSKLYFTRQPRKKSKAKMKEKAPKASK